MKSNLFTAPASTKQAFGARIKNLRLTNHWSQQDVVDIMDERGLMTLGRVFISNLENGRKDPFALPWSVIISLLMVFEVSQEELMPEIISGGTATKTAGEAADESLGKLAHARKRRVLWGKVMSDEVAAIVAPSVAEVRSHLYRNALITKPIEIEIETETETGELVGAGDGVTKTQKAS